MIYEIAESESVSAAVVRAVSEAQDCSPASLPPLYESVDPDALDALFAEPNRTDLERTGHVSFGFDGSLVTVESGRSVTVELRPEPELLP